MPAPGYVAKLSTPDSLLQLDPASTGANFSWDFSMMTAISQRADSFISPNAVPLSIRLQFPFGVTVVRVQETPDTLGGIALGEGYEVYEANNQAYEYLGLAGTVSGIPLVLENDPSDSVYVFPLNFGNEDSSYALAELNIPGLFFIRREYFRKNHVDGWGKVTTPYGTFDCLRIKSVLSESDSIAVDTLAIRVNRPKTTLYKWLAKEEKIPVVQINTTLAANVEITTQISYVDSTRDFSSTAISHFEPLQAQIYPNPTSEKLHVQLEGLLSETTHMEIRDIQGRKLFEYELNKVEQLLTLPPLSTGVYLVRLRQGNKIYQGKLEIRHNK